MIDIEFVRKKHFVEGWSIRRLSRQLGYSRQAIRKALSSPQPPRYHLSQPRPAPVMGPYRQLICEWLEQDALAPPKQRHSAKRIFDRLCLEYGFQGGESTVRQYVRGLRALRREVYVPLSACWGEQAQVDWGEAKAIIAGQEQRVYLFVLCLRASGVRFLWAAPTQKLEAFLEGHVRAFAWLGGVPKECLYDNLKAAVVRILAGNERQEQGYFSSLRAHYLFESRFCRPGQGHEKGAVENAVGYCRRNALVPVPEAPSFEALNERLLGWCEAQRQRQGTRWEQERQALRPLPQQPFESALIREAGVSRLGLVHVDHNRYSLPCERPLLKVRVKLFTQRLEFYQGETLLASHQRCHGRGQTIMLLEHYLGAFERKPQAVTHAAVVRELPAIYNLVREKLCSRPLGYREFASILLLRREFAAQALTEALQEAWARGLLQASAVRQILLNQTQPSRPEPIALPKGLEGSCLSGVDLGQYDTLLQAARAEVVAA